jgi:hypothetical protein
MYCPLNHIAQALYFDRWAEVRFVVATTIYADASGSEHDQPAILVAGFFNSVSYWTDFGKEWKIFLKRNNIDRLHMTGPSEPWKDDPVIRERVLSEALEIIERSGAIPFVFLTVSSDFNAYMAERCSEGFKNVDAFVFSGWEFVMQVEAWCKERHLSMPEFVFEASNKKQHDALREVLLAYGLPEPIFRKKQEDDPERTVVALQASDFLAYEILRGWKDLINVGRPTRPYLQAFDRISHPTWEMITKDKMDLLIPVSAAVHRIERAIAESG